METVTLQRARGHLAGETGLTEDSFTYLYQYQLKRVLNYVRYRLGAVEAEDVTAEIFARAWARRRKYDPGKGAMETWLWAIARNAVTDRLRSNRYRPPSVRLPPDLAAPSDPPTEAGQREQWQQIQTAMACLSPLDREIIALRFGAGHTNRAIAAMLGRTEANVAQRLRRALRKMRTRMQGGGLR
jgi:RNA polymerase sigma factor (sigma-70 family)